MKGKDLAFLAGGALLVYMLIPKKEAEAAPGITTIIPMPAPGEAPLDIGGLFGGIASIFGAMPTQIIPEINIPEFTWPDWEKYVPEIPDWGQYVPEWGEFAPPDWSQYIPDWGVLDPEKWMEGFLGAPDEGAPAKEPGLIDRTKDLIVKNIVAPVTEATGEAVSEPISAAGEGLTWLVNYITHPFSLEYGVLAPVFKRDIPEAFVKESEAIFEEAGISEVTPSTLDIFIKARETVTGEKAETLPSIGTPEYWERMIPTSPYIPRGVIRG